MGSASGPATSTVPFTGGSTATSASAAATSSAASGCMGAVGRRTASPAAPEPARSPRNSKNCVARRIVYGTLPDLISPSWTTFARMYPLSGRRSAPTTDRATWCPTPAAASAASRLRVEVSKNSSTAASAKDGEFVTSTTTLAPASASVSPSPVRVLTPEEGDAGTASWPRSEEGHELLPDEPAAADHNDLHVGSPQLSPVSGRSECRTLFDLGHRPAGQLVRTDRPARTGDKHVHGDPPARAAGVTSSAPGWRSAWRLAGAAPPRSGGSCPSRRGSSTPGGGPRPARRTSRPP